MTHINVDEPLNAMRYICNVEHTDGTITIVCCKKMLGFTATSDDYIELTLDEYRAILLEEEIDDKTIIYPTVKRKGYRDTIIAYTNCPEYIELRKKVINGELHEN